MSVRPAYVPFHDITVVAELKRDPEFSGPHKMVDPFHDITVVAELKLFALRLAGEVGVDPFHDITVVAELKLCVTQEPLADGAIHSMTSPSWPN